jgi:hypothetical protein
MVGSNCIQEGQPGSPSLWGAAGFTLCPMLRSRSNTNENPDDNRSALNTSHADCGARAQASRWPAYAAPVRSDAGG